MNESKSCIVIRFSDGEEAFHHGGIADKLYVSYLAELEETFNYQDETIFISYSRNKVSRVIYQRN